MPVDVCKCHLVLVEPGRPNQHPLPQDIEELDSQGLQHRRRQSSSALISIDLVRLICVRQNRPLREEVNLTRESETIQNHLTTISLVVEQVHEEKEKY